MLAPGPKQIKHVEEIMERDLCLCRLLNSRTHIIVTDSGDGLSFYPEAVQVAQALHEEGINARTAPKRDVLRVAQIVLEDKILNQGNILSKASITAPAAPAAKAPPQSTTNANNIPTASPLQGEQIEIAFGDAKGRYDVHPAAWMFPRLEGKPYASLKKSIQTDGQQDPVVLDGRTFLDGLTRQQILNELGIAPKIVQFAKLDTTMTPADWIMSKNLLRRHLTPDQILAITAKFRALCKKEREREQAKDAAAAGSTSDTAEDSSDPNKTGGDQPQDAERSTTSEFPQKPAENATKRKRGRPRAMRSEAEGLALATKQSRYKAEWILKLDQAAPELATAVAERRLTLKEAILQLKAKQPSGKARPPRQPNLGSVEEAVAKAERLLVKAASQLQPSEQDSFWKGVVLIANRQAKSEKEEASEPPPVA